MDHSLEESLSLEDMDFDHSQDVVNQEDIPLEEHNRLGSITMDMDHVEQPLLMETGQEEVIVSDLIEDPFPFQEYTIQNDDASSSHISIDPTQLNQYAIQNEPATSFQYNDDLVKPPASTSNLVTLKPLQPKISKRATATPPRQVAIAPKPTKPVQYAIAPKPVALLADKSTLGGIKKVPISSDERSKGGAVLSQIGKQLVMVPKKIKLMPSTSSDVQFILPSEQVQLIGSKGNKPIYKFIQIPAQPKSDTGQGTVITKVIPTTSPRARYVMQQKTVPISIGENTVVQNFKVAGKKQQMIAIKSQSPKVVVSASQGNVTTKKVLITSNPNQRVLYRTSAPTPSTTVIRDVVSSGQRTQYHPINVPGKGIQYIKLVTNQPSQKLTKKPLAVPSKNFVFTDSKGNVIKMTAEKVAEKGGDNKPPPLVVTAAGGKGATVKPQKKLVRIAPVPKTISQTISQAARSSQSLLAPFATLTPLSETAPVAPAAPAAPVAPAAPEAHDLMETTVSLEEFNEMVEQNNLSGYTETEYQETAAHDETVEEIVETEQNVEVKPTLQSLISDAVGDESVPGAPHHRDSVQQVETQMEIKHGIHNASFMFKHDNSTDKDASNTSMMNADESVIIVPGSYSDKQNDTMYSDDSQSQQILEDTIVPPNIGIETECIPFTPNSPMSSDQVPEVNLGMRPRKACNCTKSQCLKLYCDCFANGEFCNNCNCNNCHNNLENEEQRQKAIRSCLERNPNAFRPKIGKSKTGGPEIIRRHTKGCNCKRSGCLKNYCECYEAKIACTSMCKCVGCRNVEETLVRRRNVMRLREKFVYPGYRPAPPEGPVKQPCSFMTTEVIEAVCQCLLAAAAESDDQREDTDPVHDVIEEFARCLQDVIAASHHTL